MYDTTSSNQIGKKWILLTEERLTDWKQQLYLTHDMKQTMGWHLKQRMDTHGKHWCLVRHFFTRSKRILFRQLKLMQRQTQPKTGVDFWRICILK
jgi:hypothetical protein